MEWTIGNVKIKNQIVLAPMAGICNSSFRKIIKQMGAGLIYAEMVSDKAIFYNSKKTIDMLYMEDEERPITQQIFGSDVESFVMAAKYIYEHQHPDIIDINMGCPVPKVAVKSQAGAALLKNPQKIKEIVSAVVSSLPIPVTVKIRSGWDSDSLTWKEAATAAVEAGAAAVTLHPRTRAQGYEGSADWSLLAELSELLQRITNGRVPVFGSGDIFSPQAARDMLMQTGCSGVMFARGALGNPFIFLQTRQLLTTGQYEEVSAAQRIAAGLYELNLLCQDKGEVAACREMRKRFCAYSKGITGGSMLRGQIVEAATVSDYQRLFKPYMQSC